MTPIQQMGLILRVLWALLIMMVCLGIKDQASYITIGILSIYFFSCVNYCEQVSQQSKTADRWLITARVFSYITTLSFLVTLAYQIYGN